MALFLTAAFVKSRVIFAQFGQPHNGDVSRARVHWATDPRAGVRHEISVDQLELILGLTGNPMNGSSAFGSLRPRLRSLLGKPRSTGKSRSSTVLTLELLEARWMPAGLSADGLPLSLQIIGKAFDEATVLKTGRAIERAADFRHAPQPWWRTR